MHSPGSDLMRRSILLVPLLSNVLLYGLELMWMRREEESISWKEKGEEYYLVLWAGRVACKTESIDGPG